MIVIFVILLGILIIPLYHWEKRRDKSYNRFEEAAARELEQLDSLSQDERERRVREHPYLKSLSGAPIVEEILTRVHDGEVRALVDRWDRVSRELVAAERASGHTGAPRLTACETELLALLRSLS